MHHRSAHPKDFVRGVEKGREVKLIPDLFDFVLKGCHYRKLQCVSKAWPGTTKWVWPIKKSLFDEYVKLNNIELSLASLFHRKLLVCCKMPKSNKTEYVAVTAEGVKQFEIKTPVLMN
jgi:hypothetical protein